MTREELLKNAKPILFNTEMVRAILEDRKTVTRRVIKPQPNYIQQLRDGRFETSWDGGFDNNVEYLKPKYKIGDILYVRETYSYVYEYGSEENLKWEIKKYVYKTDESLITSLKWKPSIHMPKEAARIFLKVTNVRVERLQDITEEEAMQEGIIPNIDSFSNKLDKTSIELFSDLWNSTINKQDLDNYGWEANPWIWVIEFERVEAEV